MRTPLFDLGNVIVKLDFDPFFSWLAEKAGDPDRTRVSRFFHSSLYFDFEFGSISAETFVRRMGQLYRAEISLAEAEEKLCSIFPGLVEGMPELLEELMASGPVYCLSNTNNIHLNYLRGRFPLLTRFTGFFASCEMGKRKPYPGIYRDIADQLAIPAEDLVFFDDVPANVQGAQKAGLEAYLFTDAGQVREVLKI